MGKIVKLECKSVCENLNTARCSLYALTYYEYYTHYLLPSRYILLKFFSNVIDFNVPDMFLGLLVL